MDYSHAGNVDWMERNQKQEIPLKRVWKSLCNLCRMVENGKTWKQESLRRNLYQLVSLLTTINFQDQPSLFRLGGPYIDSFCDSELFLAIRKYRQNMLCIPSHRVFKRGKGMAGSCQHSSGQADEWAGCRVKVRILSLPLCPPHWPGSVNPSSSQVRILWPSPKGA